MLVPMPPQSALFLLAETREHPMHVGSLQLFRPPDGATSRDVSELFDRALASTEVAPLFRKRARRSITSFGQWGWEVDQHFDLEHHVRKNALPHPARVRELLVLCSRLHSSLLDRHRPLWEMHLIEGLADGRFAIYFKAHHALVDGVSALRVLSRMLSADPDEVDMPPPWAPRLRPPRTSRERDASAPADALRQALVDRRRRRGSRAGAGALGEPRDQRAGRFDLVLRAADDVQRAGDRCPQVRRAVVADRSDQAGRQGVRRDRQRRGAHDVFRRAAVVPARPGRPARGPADRDGAGVVAR